MLELGGAVVSVLDRLDREDVRLLPLRRVIASAVGLRWVRRQHSPLVAMHHMILCARRKFFEITTKPNSGIRAQVIDVDVICTSRTQVSCGRYKSYCLPACHTLVRRYCWTRRPGPTLRVRLRETGSLDVLCTEMACGRLSLQL